MDKVGKRINKKSSPASKLDPDKKNKKQDSEVKQTEFLKMKTKKNKEIPGFINRPDKKKSNLPRKKVE